MVLLIKLDYPFCIYCSTKSSIQWDNHSGVFCTLVVHFSMQETILSQTTSFTFNARLIIYLSLTHWFSFTEFLWVTDLNYRQRTWFLLNPTLTDRPSWKIFKYSYSIIFLIRVTIFIQILMQKGPSNCYKIFLKIP